MSRNSDDEYEEDVKCEFCSNKATYRAKSKLTKEITNMCANHLKQYGYGESFKIAAITDYTVTGFITKKFLITVRARDEASAIRKALKSDIYEWDEDDNDEYSTSDIKNVTAKEYNEEEEIY